MKFIAALQSIACLWSAEFDETYFAQIRKQNEEHDKKATVYTTIAYKIAGEVAEKIKKKYSKSYKLAPCGFGGSMMDHIKKITIAFSCTQKLNPETISDILHDCSQIFVDQINNDKEIVPYLAKYPADTDNIEILIHFIFNETCTPTDIIGCSANEKQISFMRDNGQFEYMPLNIPK